MYVSAGRLPPRALSRRASGGSDDSWAWTTYRKRHSGSTGGAVAAQEEGEGGSGGDVRRRKGSRHFPRVKISMFRGCLNEREKRKHCSKGVYEAEHMETSHDHIAIKGKYFAENTLDKTHSIPRTDSGKSGSEITSLIRVMIKR